MPYLKNAQICLKINGHTIKFVFMYHKHNSGKNYNINICKKYFENTSEAGGTANIWLQRSIGCSE
jgi:hypothetical protein